MKNEVERNLSGLSFNRILLLLFCLSVAKDQRSLAATSGVAVRWSALLVL